MQCKRNSREPRAPRRTKHLARLVGVILIFSAWNASTRFAPGDTASTEPKTAYLAIYFLQKKAFTSQQDEKLYYAIAQEGLRFSDAVNHQMPIVAATVGARIIRDPMILRDPDGKTFHLCATVSGHGRSLVLFDSDDLIHWKNQRLVVVAPPDADITWAPEILWDPETKQYVIYWTSSINRVWDTAAIWYATSQDLKTFSPPKILMGEQRGCLDADVIHARGKWYMVYRFNGIWIRTADHALGPYEHPVEIVHLDVEGPEIFPINGKSDEWALVFDYFRGNQGRWGFATSHDLTHWTMATRPNNPYYTPDVFFPPGMRHGYVLPITSHEADAILSAFGSTKFDYQGHPQSGK